MFAYFIDKIKINKKPLLSPENDTNIVFEDITLDFDGVKITSITISNRLLKEFYRLYRADWTFTYWLAYLKFDTLDQQRLIAFCLDTNKIANGNNIKDEDEFFNTIAGFLKPNKNF